MLTLIAQAADPLSNGGGWFGAGLLGLVLAWLLLKYLPEKDSQLKELVETHAALVKDIHDACAAERKDSNKTLNALTGVIAKLSSRIESRFPDMTKEE
jgi:hypothetical protein